MQSTSWFNALLNANCIGLDVLCIAQFYKFTHFDHISKTFGRLKFNVNNETELLLFAVHIAVLLHCG